MPDRSDLNTIAITGVLHRPLEASEHWMACELKIRDAEDTVVFVPVRLDLALARRLDGVPLGTRVYVRGTLGFAWGAGGLLIKAREVRLLPAGATLRQGR